MRIKNEKIDISFWNFKMKTYIEKDILHVIYTQINDVPKYIIDFANLYEGHIQNRTGFNFPMDFIRRNYPKHDFIKYPAKYIIVYKQGDIQTKKHELLHAKFYIDISYQKSIEKLWESFSHKYRENVRSTLKKLKYPEKVFLDEFQAYFFTEKNFFGKPEY